MNKLFLFVSIFFAASIFFACNKTETAQERLRKEQKAISRFISDRGFIITNNPAEMYDDNVFYKTREGLYIHVIDSGNGNKAKYNQEILVRFRDLILFKSDSTVRMSNEAADQSPVKFRFGNYSTYGTDAWTLSGEGLAIGLSLVSDDAIVRLIIPSGLQASSRQSYFQPMYIGSLRYRINELIEN